MLGPWLYKGDLGSGAGAGGFGGGWGADPMGHKREHAVVWTENSRKSALRFKLFRLLEGFYQKRPPNCHCGFMGDTIGLEESNLFKAATC